MSQAGLVCTVVMNLYYNISNYRVVYWFDN